MTVEHALTLFVSTVAGSAAGTLAVYAVFFWRPWR